MNSIWELDTKLPQFPPLDGDMHTDVLIVGGGLAGLMCAWTLTQAGIDCVLIEQNRIMQGVSGRTTAKITTQHGLIYSKLLSKYGSEQARLYWQANAEALASIRKIAMEADCAFEVENSYLYQRDDGKALRTEMEACEQLGIPARWEKTLSLPFSVKGAICFPDQAQFHPLRFASYLAKDLKICENTKALAFSDNRVQTSAGTISAEKIIIATHFPIINKHGSYFLKMYQQRSYVIALENAELVKGMYRDCCENGLSFRSAGKYLLLGGGGHRTGKQGTGWMLPEETAGNYYPNARIAARWAAQDCMTLDGMPYVGRYSKGVPDLYVATGFQKWGMTASMAAAGILKDLVLGRTNPYAELFSPSRNMFHKQLLLNGFDSVANLLRPTVPRCPHLGCALKWNKEEHSWDCPCHGSRFDGDGSLLDNPATDDLKKPPKKE